MERYRAEWKANPTEATQTAWDASLEAVSQLRSQYDGIVEKINKLDSSIADDRLSLDYIAEAGGRIAQEIQKEEQAANQKVESEKQAAEYEERQKSILERISSVLIRTGKEAKETIHAAFSGLMERFVGFLRSIPAAVKSAFGAVSDIARGALSGLTKFLYRLNVFSKIADTIGPKITRILNLAKRVFVFSMITKGLRYLRTEMGKYLSSSNEVTSALRNLKGAFLTAFQPIYNVVVPALTTFLNTLTRVISAVAQFTAALFGTTAKQAQENAKSLYEQANATEAAGDAAKDAERSLASFDEINKLSGNQKTGGGAAAEIAPAFEAEMDGTVFDSWGDAFDHFLDNILNNGIPALEAGLSSFSNWLNTFSQNLYGMFTFPGVLDKVKQIGTELSNALNQMVLRIDWNALGLALGAGLNTAIAFLASLIYTFDWMNLGASLAAMINRAVSQIDWYAFGQLLFAGWKIAVEFLAGLLLALDMAQLAQAASRLVIGFFDSMTETIQKIDWHLLGQQIMTFLVNIDWTGIATSVFAAIGSAFGAVVSVLWELIHSAWETVVNWWHDTAYEDGKFTLQGLLDGILDAMSDIGRWIKNHIFAPFMDGFCKVFGIHSPSTEMYSMGDYMMQGMANGINENASPVTSSFQLVLDALRTEFDTWNANFMSGFTQFEETFYDRWKIVWSNANIQFVNSWNNILDTFQEGVNNAISALNELVAEANALAGLTGTQYKFANQINVPKLTIPKLAQGAVIPPNKEFMAVLGDQKQGTNIETPLATMVQAFKQALSETGYSGGSEAVLMLDRDVLGKVVYRLNKSESNRIGVNLTET